MASGCRSLLTIHAPLANMLQRRLKSCARDSASESCCTSTPAPLGSTLRPTFTYHRPYSSFLVNCRLLNQPLLLSVATPLPALWRRPTLTLLSQRAPKEDFPRRCAPVLSTWLSTSGALKRAP